MPLQAGLYRVWQHILPQLSTSNLNTSLKPNATPCSRTHIYTITVQETVDLQLLLMPHSLTWLADSVHAAEDGVGSMNSSSHQLLCTCNASGGSKPSRLLALA